MAFIFVALLNAAAVALGVRFARKRDERSLGRLRSAAKLVLVICLPLGLIGIFNAFLDDELHGLVDRYLVLAVSAPPMLVAASVLFRANSRNCPSDAQSDQHAPPH